MQEIAESLRGVGVPVMVKNPVNPELGLWVGALERLNKVGVTRILAIHRGFSSFAPSEYRNEPFWEIPIELKRRAPSLPILCDPSHIAGDASLVARIAQKAIEMDMEGLMIEVHVRPKDALSDAGQQLDPAQFDALLSSLVLRRSASADAEFNRRLAVLRGVIDQLDRRLLETLAERMRVVEEIGQWKREKEVTVFQLERWAEICQTRRSKGHSLGLDQALVKELFELIHKHGIRRQIP
jgi:chorismate mutase